MSKQAGEWALVTGASSGLGIAFVQALASRRCKVVLAARREEPMQALAAELRQTRQVEAIVESIDLSVLGSPTDLQKRLDARGLQPDILINNAGFGLSGEFLTQKPERLREMLEFDINSLMELTHLSANPCRRVTRDTFFWWQVWGPTGPILCWRPMARRSTLCSRSGLPFMLNLHPGWASPWSLPD